MTAAACHTLAKRGLTLADIQFLDHLISCGRTWRLTDHLTPDLTHNGARGTAPLARLIHKLRCGRPGELDPALLILTNGQLEEGSMKRTAEAQTRTPTRRRPIRAN